MNAYEAILNYQTEFFRSGQTKPIAFRIAMLKKLKLAILRNEQVIIKALHKDLGKSKHEAIMTEIGFTLAEINTMIKGLKSFSRPKMKKMNINTFPSRAFTYREPYGKTLIIGPWNYPFQLVISPLIGAIAGGNCMLVKPSELTPHTAQAIDDLISNTFNPRYITVVQGGIPETTALLDCHFDKIFFTGSTNVGKIVMKRASKHLTPVTLELGGKSPTIIDQTANLKLAAKRIVFGKGVNSGQTCVAPDYVIVHESVKEAFYVEFMKAVRHLYGRDLLGNPDYGRILNKANYNRVKRYLNDGKVIFGGNTNDEKLHIDLTLLEINHFDVSIMKEEIFGPILPVVTYRHYKDILDIVNKNPDPLALYLFTRNKEMARRIVKDVPFGGGCINDTIMHLTNEHLPFGGRGASGMGSYHGKYSFEVFTHEKAVLKSCTKVDIPLRYPPFTEDVLRILKKIMY